MELLERLYGPNQKPNAQKQDLFAAAATDVLGKLIAIMDEYNEACNEILSDAAEGAKEWQQSLTELYGITAENAAAAEAPTPTPAPAETYPLNVDRLTLSMDFEEFCQWRLRRQVDRLVEAYTNQDLEVSELEAGFQRERGEIERLTEAFYKAIGV